MPLPAPRLDGTAAHPGCAQTCPASPGKGSTAPRGWTPRWTACLGSGGSNHSSGYGMHKVILSKTSNMQTVILGFSLKHHLPLCYSASIPISNNLYS